MKFIKRISLLAIFITSILTGCSVLKKSVSQDLLRNEIFQQTAFDHFGNDTLIVFNPQKTFILCINNEQKNALNPNNTTDFFVYNLQDNKIILTDKIANATVTWKDEVSLLVKVRVGIINNVDDRGLRYYTINILTNEKSSISKAKFEK